MVKVLINVKYGYLNITIFHTIHKILLKWYDQVQQQPPRQRGRMHKYLSGEQRHRREKNINTDLKIAVNFRFPYEGR
jgi:hypothetical protein